MEKMKKGLQVNVRRKISRLKSGSSGKMSLDSKCSSEDGSSVKSESENRHSTSSIESLSFNPTSTRDPTANCCSSSVDGDSGSSSAEKSALVHDGPFIGRARVIVDYTPSPYDKDALRLKKGDVIDVVAMNATGLWTGVLRNKLGYFKFINVELMADGAAKRKARGKARRGSDAESRTHRRAGSIRRGKPKSVEDLLQRMNLEEHISVFLLNGYEDLDLFKELEEKDLDYLGIKDTAHRTKIMTAVELLYDYDSDPLVEDSPSSHLSPPSVTPKPSTPDRSSQDDDSPRDSGCYASTENLPDDATTTTPVPMPRKLLSPEPTDARPKPSQRPVTYDETMRNEEKKSYRKFSDSCVTRIEVGSDYSGSPDPPSYPPPSPLAGDIGYMNSSYQPQYTNWNHKDQTKVDNWPDKPAPNGGSKEEHLDSAKPKKDSLYVNDDGSTVKLRQKSFLHSSSFASGYLSKPACPPPPPPPVPPRNSTMVPEQVVPPPIPHHSTPIAKEVVDAENKINKISCDVVVDGEAEDQPRTIVGMLAMARQNVSRLPRRLLSMQEPPAEEEREELPPRSSFNPNKSVQIPDKNLKQTAFYSNIENIKNFANTMEVDPSFYGDETYDTTKLQVSDVDDKAPSPVMNSPFNVSNPKMTMSTFGGSKTNLSPTKSTAFYENNNSDERVSFSLEIAIESKLHEENIDLTQKPYSDLAGFCGIPPALVLRYAEELQKDTRDVANALDHIRTCHLRKINRTAVPNDFIADSCQTPVHEANYSSLADWLISLGLPMYAPCLQKAGFTRLDQIINLTEPELKVYGVTSFRHSKWLAAAIQGLKFHFETYSC